MSDAPQDQIEETPDQSLEDLNSDDLVPTQDEGDTEDNLIYLYDGLSLSNDEVASISAYEETLLYLVAGPHDSGKTTLIASIWELFSISSIADFIFAGSKTLAGLEKRCHYSRTSSGRAVPTTKHTGLTENNILHIRIRKSNLIEDPINVLFSDLAGERYRLVRDSVDEAKKMELVLRADSLVLLVDCAKMVQPKEMHSTSADGRMILKSFLDSKMLNHQSNVDVVFSKWDYVTAAHGKNGTPNYIQEVMDEFQRLFSKRLSNLRFHFVAARNSQDPSLDFGFNLEDLFSTLISELPSREYIDPGIGINSPARHIDRFGDKGDGIRNE